MTQQASNREFQQKGRAATESVPAFKPVALPALAAAVRAAQRPPAARKKYELPAVLRKEADDN